MNKINVISCASVASSAAVTEVHWRILANLGFKSRSCLLFYYQSYLIMFTATAAQYCIEPNPKCIHYTFLVSNHNWWCLANLFNSGPDLRGAQGAQAPGLVLTGGLPPNPSYFFRSWYVSCIFTARGYAKRGICRRRVSVCLSHSGIVSKRLYVYMYI